MVDGYMIAQGKDEPVCIASLATRTVSGRDAAFAFHLHKSSGRAYLFSLPPSGGPGGKSDRVSVQIDGKELAFGRVQFGADGGFQLPIFSKREWDALARGLKSGKYLMIIFEKNADTLVIPLPEFRNMRAALQDCLESA